MRTPTSALHSHLQIARLYRAVDAMPGLPAHDWNAGY
jgi:hypothetical protein